jgi:hypothetical protein
MVDKMCAHTSGRLEIEGCGNLNCVRNAVEKIGVNNRKVGKIG